MVSLMYCSLVLLRPPKKEVMFSLLLVCLSVLLFVFLSSGLLDKLSTDFHEILWVNEALERDESVWFWDRSGSRPGYKINFSIFQT